MFWGKLWRRASPLDDSADGRLLGLPSSSIAFIDNISSEIISTSFFFESFKSFLSLLINEDRWFIFSAHQEVEIFNRRHNKQSTFLDAQNQHFLMTSFPHKKPNVPEISRTTDSIDLCCLHCPVDVFTAITQIWGSRQRALSAFTCDWI